MGPVSRCDPRPAEEVRTRPTELCLGPNRGFMSEACLSRRFRRCWGHLDPGDGAGGLRPVALSGVPARLGRSSPRSSERSLRSLKPLAWTHDARTGVGSSRHVRSCVRRTTPAPRQVRSLKWKVIFTPLRHLDRRQTLPTNRRAIPAKNGMSNTKLRVVTLSPGIPSMPTRTSAPPVIRTVWVRDEAELRSVRGALLKTVSAR